MCFGTFDILHLGHLNYFEQAKKYGDYLMVVIARDKTKQDQKKITLFNEEERKKIVDSLKIVDEVVLGYPDHHFKIIQEKQPEVICLGYDHEIDEKELKLKLASLKLYPKIYRMKAYKPEIHKSGKIKEVILKNLQ